MAGTQIIQQDISIHQVRLVILMVRWNLAQFTAFFGGLSSTIRYGIGGDKIQ
jgi:hypothetical protein